MEIVIAIVIGIWLLLAGVFYGVFVKKEFKRFEVPYSKADVEALKNAPGVQGKTPGQSGTE